MTDDAFTADLIGVLRKHNRVSHFLRAGGEKPMPPSAVVQRALSSGLPTVIPLPDGTAAVHAPEGIPASLAIFGIMAEALETSRHASPAPVEEFGLSEDVSEQDPAPGSTGDSLQRGEEITPEALMPTEPDAAPQPRGVPQEDTTALTNAPNDDALLDALARIEAQLSSTAETALAPQDLQPVGPDLDTRLTAIEGALQALQDTQNTAPALEPIATQLSALPDQMADQISQARAQLNQQAEDMATRLGATDISPLEEQIAELGRALVDRPEATDTAQALAGVESRLSELVAAQADQTETNQMIGVITRFSTALAAALRRLEHVATTLETDTSQKVAAFDAQSILDAISALKIDALHDQLAALSQPDGTESAPAPAPLDGLGDGLSAIAAALAQHDKTNTIDGELILRELSEVTSLQHATLNQIAALVTSSGSASRAKAEEFVLDLRHSIIEMIAAEKRRTQAA